MSLKLRLYVYAVIALALVALVSLGLPTDLSSVRAIAVYAAMAILFEALAIKAPFASVTVSVGFVPTLAAALAYGPLVGLWVGVLGSLNWHSLRGGKPLYRNAFNAAQAGLAGAAAGWVWQRSWAGGAVLLTAESIASMVLAFLVYFVVNAVLPLTAVAIQRGRSLLEIYRPLIGWALPTYFATAPLAALIALLYTSAGYIAVVLFLLPLLLARMSLQLYRDTRRGYIETVQALADAIDAKDTYTGGHSARVSFYARELGRKLGWQQERLEQLTFMALLHDIGKIGIKDQLLNKPGRYNDDEKLTVNNHASLGADIIGRSTPLRVIANYVRHHHEHYNGKGYPNGLQGEDIPEGARIIAVADCFDAITSVRTYTTARPVHAALEELRRCSGTQFDPQVVRAMEELMRERGEVAAAVQEVAAAKASVLASLQNE
ncbi:MAG: HD domain-containing protein [Selenomonadales bacterium]|nr:HD domain-containing protein [Selenomonadales bacterium]